jgi:LemA protein
VAEERLVSMLEELGLALQDLTSGDGPDAVVSDLLRQRDQLQEQIAFSRQVYNHAADAYNQAIALFPTTLVANLLRFHRAPEFPPI